MTGYDLVSLDLTDKSKHAGSLPFQEKILLPEESQRFNDFLHENYFISACWSVKESVYKAVPNIAQKRFNPHKVVIHDIHKTALGWKAFSEAEGRVFYSRVIQNSEYLQTVSSTSPEELSETQYFSFQLDEAELPSLALRDRISEYLEKLESDLALYFFPNGKPGLVKNEEVLENISLSHDGAFAGFAHTPKSN